MKKQHLVPAVVVVLLAVFALAAFLYDSQKAAEMNAAAMKKTSHLVRDYSPTKGSADAKVTIVEFFDPACETCRAFHPIVEELLASNPGKVRVVMRYAPFHKDSDYVVKALEAARLQGKYWQALEAVYGAQPTWASHGNPDTRKIWQPLRRAGIDVEKAQEEMNSAEIAARLQQDMADVQQLQVTKTPGFFVNGKPLIKFGAKELKNLVSQEILNNYY
jgi:protein-disulfide isomerase